MKQITVQIYAFNSSSFRCWMINQPVTIYIYRKIIKFLKLKQYSFLNQLNKAYIRVRELILYVNDNKLQTNRGVAMNTILKHHDTNHAKQA